jgi:acyl-CoA synthetase (AMP-forming)/AMP-acid ligase II
MFANKPDSVGRAMPGATVEIVDETGAALPSGSVGQIVYRGPNVMYGYAVSRECLAKDDELNGRLETGDIGWLDADGDLYITGRNKRFAKIAGLRIGLDEVERRLKPDFDVALLPSDESIVIFSVPSRATTESIASRLSSLANEYKIPMRSFVIREVGAIPILPSGKVDFARLRGFT